MKTYKNKIIHRADKKPILYDLYLPENSKSEQLVIFIHGYKGFKDWGAWEAVAKFFVKENIAFLKFNFSHNGTTIKNPTDITDLEAFAMNNYSLELEDLDAVISYAHSEEFPIKHHYTTLMGHSRGGGIAIIKSKEDKRINKVVTLAGVSDFRIRFQENTEAFEKWSETGITYIENTRTKQQLPHYFQFFEDFMANETRFTIKNAMASLNQPILIIQGTGDFSVTTEEAWALKKYNPNAELFFIEDADHVFGAQHPWEADFLPNDLEKAIRKSIEFIKKL